MADDARPRAFCALGNKGKRDACDCHPDRVPESRLHEKGESYPTDPMDNPPSPAESQFLPGQHITPPPQFLPADVTHQHHDSIVDGNPPGTLQRDAHEIVGAEMAEELGVEPRRVEESYKIGRA